MKNYVCSQELEDQETAKISILNYLYRTDIIFNLSLDVHLFCSWHHYLSIYHIAWRILQSRMQNIICICDTLCTFGYELNVLRFIYNTGRIASLEHGLPFVACMMITNVTVKRCCKKQENLDLIQKVSWKQSNNPKYFEKNC